MITAEQRARYAKTERLRQARRTPEQRESDRDKRRAYTAKNREKFQRYMYYYNKRYHAANRKKHNESSKRWGDLNRDHKREKDREYAQANKASKKDYDAARFKQNSTAVRERASAWFQAHKNDPEFMVKARARSNKRRALKKAASVNLKGINNFIKGVFSKPFAFCYYCGKRTSTKLIHFDHIVALAKGGLHSVENLCVSCAACNLSKGAKPLLEWARENAEQQLLNL